MVYYVVYFQYFLCSSYSMMDILLQVFLKWHGVIIVRKMGDFKELSDIF